MEKTQWKSLYSRHFLISLFFTAGLISFEFFLFPRYYESFNTVNFLQSGVYIKPLKTFAMIGPSFLLSVFFVFQMNFRAAEPRGIKRKDSVDLNRLLHLDF